MITSLYKNNCPIDHEKAMFYAGRKGCPEFLSFLLDCGCALTADITAGAATGGHLSFLKYLLSFGVASHNYAPFLAASNGHVDVLDFLLSKEKRGEFARKKTWVTFSDGYHLDFIKTNMLEYAFEKGNTALYQWLLSYS